MQQSAREVSRSRGLEEEAIVIVPSMYYCRYLVDDATTTDDGSCVESCEDTLHQSNQLVQNADRQALDE
jgi:hypothetical protein